MNHPNGPAKSHAQFQPDIYKTDGDVGPQMDGRWQTGRHHGGICDVACQNQALLARHRSVLELKSGYPQDVESGLLAELVS